MATSDGARYRRIVEREGLSPTHRQVIDWTPEGSRVLEVGCASGYVGRVLIREKACTVTGVEVEAAAAAEARQNGLTVFEGSLEAPAFWDSIPGRFDVIIAADVLEHLREPDRVLERFKASLLPGGIAIIAVPNVAVWSMRKRLFFRGDFRYEDAGLLDRTHVHFFTWDTLHELVESQHWAVEGTMVEGWDLPIGRQLFVKIPARLRRRLENLATESDALQGVHDALTRGSDGVVNLGAALAARLSQRWPNLCAAHIALKLRPPAQ
ncbi:MAG TPA: class I SAM-dependent methyltransferase [Polyangiaceae bacterium]|jgi:methionine biosynthesis protein MetW|nr:class I SAM-dependent methyltransferase [Polyangiaceae bacterium]